MLIQEAHEGLGTTKNTKRTKGTKDRNREGREDREAIFFRHEFDEYIFLATD